MKQILKNVIRPAIDAVQWALDKTGRTIVRSDRLVDFYLHEYDSYEQYREIQIRFNKKKLSWVWADAQTLNLVADIVQREVDSEKVLGICHGTRNGFEQKHFNDGFPNFEVIGTDISDTASDYPNSVVWDFHDRNEEWLGKFDFVYSNSLDQGWKPREALKQWLAQIHRDGVVVIEHTEGHGPTGASEMDPFGVRPHAMPYVIAEWFGHQVSVSFEKCVKDNNGHAAWLFVIRKNVDEVE